MRHVRSKRTRLPIGAGALLIAALAIGVFAAPAAAAPPAPYAYGENDAGGFLNILPPGEGSNVNTVEGAAFLATGARPPHDQDQLRMYGDLVYAVPGLQAADLSGYFKDASFGVPAADVERTYSPRADVTIVRDEFGVPHIYGLDRNGAMFGAGYVAAEDRLFFIDILRHAGRAQTSSFVGGANTGMDEDVWADTPYNEGDMQRQFNLADEVYGSVGTQLQSDTLQYVAGINRYIEEARTDPDKLPVEYAAIERPLGPDPFEATDIISIASLVAGIFGKGGGNELGSAVVLEEARKRFGRKQGQRVWADFRSAEDPEAPTTVQGRRFPYQTVGRGPKPGVALPDRGTLREEPTVIAASGSAASTTGSAGSANADGEIVGGLLSGLAGLDGGSNALLVSARESESGRPIAVMGPQTSYFAPQILMEQSLHAPASAAGPAIDVRGVAFPGTNVVVQLGHGRDYAWSATSAGQDIVDTFAVPLCKPGGGRPGMKATHYRYGGRCRPFEVLTRINDWEPNLADGTAAGSQTLRALRTPVGIVTARARIDGKPYAYTKLRVTYNHEVDSAIGFSAFNTPSAMNTPREFFRAACDINLTFNWLYINRRHIAYFNSGANPVRSPLTDPNFPAFANKRYRWRDYETRLYTEDQIPCKKRPQVIDQPYLTSWNNKQAPGYRASDARFDWSSLDRVLPLNDRIEEGIRGRRKMNLVELVSAMEDAGTVDLRGAYILPWILRVTGGDPGGAVGAALKTLKDWMRAGAHRRDLDADGVYDQARAVQIMDAWWPLLVEAQFKPTLGEDLFEAIEHMVGLVDAPGDNNPNQGSAFDDGWWFVEKDLRTILGAPVRGEYSRIYCGRGDLRRCRTALLSSLRAALKVPYAETYPASCAQGDSQWCYDAVEHQATGLIPQPPIHWINRPTFQQVVEIGR